jgi:hypothetical protein
VLARTPPTTSAFAVPYEAPGLHQCVLDDASQRRFINIMSGTTPWLSSYTLATDYEERRAEYAIAEEHSLLTPSATSHTYYAASSEKPLPRINYGWRNHLASLGWRPKTLMPGFLLGFAMISVVILLTLEFMLRRSKKFGAIAFVSEETKFIDYCFTYGPQLFAILYSLLFGSIDHDLKRLEAFFQLSSRDGASAEDSLFLSYHYKMACFVPFFAFRHRFEIIAQIPVSTRINTERRNSRHFAVLCSSCASVLCLLGTHNLDKIPYIDRVSRKI